MESMESAELNTFTGEHFGTFELKGNDGANKKLQVKCVSWRRRPCVILNMESGQPMDPVLYVPYTIKIDKLAILIEKVEVELAGREQKAGAR